ncbi:MAG: cadherin-like domain-containing protein [Gammaproteobacteria bacterium]|nr:cadherin-like domain-containing protein [Gammaproteobacteria bacterium]MDH5802770.1 cadherin-like domain-containing protein [Gammaproteobacteria bacterium]
MALRSILTRVFILISIFLLQACGGDNDGLEGSSISIRPISFEVEKTQPFTTVSVFDYITDSKGVPFVVGWNAAITAQYGSVAYNGDGTFTYTPSANIVSGTDRFSFKVANDTGSTAQGIVTLNIAKGWGQAKVLANSSGTMNSTWVHGIYEIANEIYAVYRNDSNGNYISKVDQSTGVWIDPVFAGTSLVIVDQFDAKLKLFNMTVSGNTTSVNYQEFDPADNSLTTALPLEILTGTDYNINRGIVDGNGNIFLQITHRTGTTTFTNDYMGKFYDRNTGIWHETVKAFDNSLGTVQQNEPKLAGGKPIILVRMPGNRLPQIYEYNKSSRNWSNTPLSTDTPLANSVGWFSTRQNQQGDVAIIWYHSANDATLAQDVRRVKANIYSVAGGSFSADITLEQYPINKQVQATIALSNQDFLFMWRDWESSVTGGDVRSRVYNAATANFLTSAPITVVAGHVDSYANPTPTPIVADNGNAVFKYWTKDANNNYTHYFKALPFRGTWTAAQTVNTTLTSVASIVGQFDDHGNYYSLHTDGNIQIQQFDFATLTGSAVVPVGESNTMHSLNINSTQSGRVFLTRYQQQTGGTTYNKCIDEIAVGSVFSADAITSLGCIATNYSGSFYDSDSTLFEDSENILHVVNNNIYEISVSMYKEGAWTTPYVMYEAPAGYQYTTGLTTFIRAYGNGSIAMLAFNRLENFSTYVNASAIIGNIFN